MIGAERERHIVLHILLHTIDLLPRTQLISTSLEPSIYPGTWEADNKYLVN